MTREEAITILNMVEAHGSLVVQAKDMAIKALDQEDAIEKIRAEVESINPWALRYAPTYDEDIRPQIVSNVKEHVLEIIDKYKEDT